MTRNKSRWLILLICFGAKSLSAQAAKHVILISIGGFYPGMYLDKCWQTPNLHRLMKQGVYANYMKSVFPSCTYPAHTAMITGALPARSGINFNKLTGSDKECFGLVNNIKTPTLWQVLKAKGITTAGVGWPGSISRDMTWDLPEIGEVKQPDDRVTCALQYTTPGLIEEIQRNVTGKLDSNSASADCFGTDQQAGRIAAYIFKTRRPALLAVHFAGIEFQEHAYGRNADSVKLAVAWADRIIGELLEDLHWNVLQDSTAVIIVGDHGFSMVNMVFRPNMLIRDAQARFVTSGGAAFLYRYTGTRKEDIPSLIKAVTASLDGLPSEKRRLFKVLDRRELDRMGADSAILMALAAKPGMIFSEAVNKSQSTLAQQSSADGIFMATHGGNHGYDSSLADMHAGFIAEGAGIQKGAHIAELCVTDIAPLVARLLGIEFKTPDGKLVPDIINANNN
jgi:predicted AlkP superfamily pyrophosphatase or phosphodiesterase